MEQGLLGLAAQEQVGGKAGRGRGGGLVPDLVAKQRCQSNRMNPCKCKKRWTPPLLHHCPTHKSFPGWSKVICKTCLTPAATQLRILVQL